jgi:hypothetical protein
MLAEDIRPRVSGKMSAIRRAAAWQSVHSATNGNASWCDDGSSGNGTCDGNGSTCSDAAGPVNALSANDGACFHRAQGDEASHQHKSDDYMLHDCFSLSCEGAMICIERAIKI